MIVDSHFSERFIAIGAPGPGHRRAFSQSEKDLSEQILIPISTAQRKWRMAEADVAPRPGARKEGVHSELKANNQAQEELLGNKFVGASNTQWFVLPNDWQRFSGLDRNES